MTAVKVFSAVAGIVVALVLTGWFNQYTFFVIALIGGIAGGILVYRLLVKWLGENTGG